MSSRARPGIDPDIVATYSRLGQALRGGRALLTLLVTTSALSAAAAAPQDPALDEWFPSLRVGMWVKVEGKRTPAGTLEASRIRVYDAELDEEDVESEVAAVDLVRMTLETTVGVRVVATPSTEIEGPRHQRHMILASLEVGDRIDIEGQLQKDGSLLAEKIDIEKLRRLQPGQPPENKHKLTARIESIDAARHRIVMFGLPVQFSEATRIRLPD